MVGDGPQFVPALDAVDPKHLSVKSHVASLDVKKVGNDFLRLFSLRLVRGVRLPDEADVLRNFKTHRMKSFQHLSLGGYPGEAREFVR